MARIDEHIDDKLIARLRNGDMDAFRNIYNSFCEPLYHFAFSNLKNSFEVEEIVPDVFLKIGKKARS